MEMLGNAKKRRGEELPGIHVQTTKISRQLRVCRVRSIYGISPVSSLEAKLKLIDIIFERDGRLQIV